METLEILQTLSLVMAQVVAITMALVSITKQFKVAKKWLPVFALGYGCAVTFMFIGISWVAVLVGIISGLSSMGLWTGTKTVLKK